jgi:hypothetical protein
LEKNSGQFCNNSVHGWWWWCCCVGFMVLLVERWAEPGCGSSCTGFLPAAARDCWILRRMIWNGVIWCGNNTDEVDDGPLQRATILQLHRSQHGLSHLPHLMLILHFQTWIPKVWCVWFPSFFAYLLNLHLFTKPSSDNFVGFGRWWQQQWQSAVRSSCRQTLLTLWKRWERHIFEWEKLKNFEENMSYFCEISKEIQSRSMLQEPSFMQIGKRQFQFENP